MSKHVGTLIILIALFSSVAFGSESLKVLTFNIYRKPEPFGLGGSQAARRVKYLCQVLKKTDYAAVLIQEAWLSKDRLMLENCGYPFVLNLGTNDSRGIGRAAHAHREQNLESGLLILSRFPFVKAYRHSYGQRGDWWRIFSDGETLASKAAYAGQIQLPNGRKVWLVNTHLAANYCRSYPRFDCSSYEDVRAAQLEELSVLVKKLDGPVIVGGDFNMGPSLVSLDSVWNHFDDYFPNFEQAPFDPIRDSTSSVRNNFNFEEMGKIDHLFGSEHFRVTDGATVFTQLMNIDNRSLHLSDHFGWESLFHLD